MVSDKTIRNECGSRAEAVAVRQLAIRNVWRIRIALGSNVDVKVKITAVGLRLGARRFIITQYNRIWDRMSKKSWSK
jgi:hypothetical protein